MWPLKNDLLIPIFPLSLFQSVSGVVQYSMWNKFYLKVKKVQSWKEKRHCWWWLWYLRKVCFDWLIDRILVKLLNIECPHFVLMLFVTPFFSTLFLYLPVCFPCMSCVEVNKLIILQVLCYLCINMWVIKPSHFN